MRVIVVNYNAEDLPKRLTHTFLLTGDELCQNVELNIMLIKNGIISISEWDQ